MWLRLVNGVYCFLPKDSCSSIQPLIHLLIFLACFLGANTFLPLFSGCKVPGRWVLPHVWGPGRAWMNTGVNTNEAITERRLKQEAVLAEGKFKEGARGAVLRRARSVLLWFPPSSPSRPHMTHVSKQKGGKDGREGRPWTCLRLHHLPTLFIHPSTFIPLLKILYTCLYILCIWKDIYL